jgi:streptogramin lyase
LSAAILCACGGDGPARGGDDGIGSGGISDSNGATEGESNSDSQASDSQASDSQDSQASDSQASDDNGNDGGIPVFDVGAPDGESTCDNGGGGGGATDFSYIWIANSPEGTVSKINTQTLIEEGRYLVRSDGGVGNPSRTSVNLNGDMAVANRSGGVTMIRARHEQCLDAGNTSSGSADVKPWMDGCVQWFTPFAYTSQRPVAWTQGEWSEGSCRYEDAKLWTSGANASIDVVLIDGETGVVEQTVPIPGVAPNYFGIYGGAVDNEGNFWGSQLGLGSIVRVKLSDFSVDVWPMDQSGYGMTVDQKGRVWTCSSYVARFDPATETWANNAGMGVSTSGGGCMVDADGILWVGGYSPSYNLTGIDMDTLALFKTVAIPGYAKGISIDFEGNVWAVSTGPDAYRVDPATDQVDTFTGLTNPYTYSDMTGFALSNAGGPAG